MLFQETWGKLIACQKRFNAKFSLTFYFSSAVIGYKPKGKIFYLKHGYKSYLRKEKHLYSYYVVQVGCPLVVEQIVGSINIGIRGVMSWF
jgi:hypothetical protein